MNVRITPARITGKIAAIPSKSAAHRLLILAALANGETRLLLESGSADIDATIRCLRAIGAQIEAKPGMLSVNGISSHADNPLLDCTESGSTLRFLLPVALHVCGAARFTGSGRLPERPIGELKRAMEAHGACFSAERLPFSVRGKLNGGLYELPGNVSSQYLTGLLLALPMVGANSIIALTTRLESAAYVDMTLAATDRYGARVFVRDGIYRIPGAQSYRSPGTVHVEGDWSNAAFFLAAGALCAPVRVTGLEADSPQGDKEILNALRSFGAKVTTESGEIEVSPAHLTGCELDVSETPDLLPVLAVLAACADGETRLVNAARLRLKESDRLKAAAEMIEALGGRARQLPDGLVVRGGALSGGTVNSSHDHRIAMAAAVAALRCRNPVTILDAGAVAKSYPAFFEDYNRIGGKADVI